MRSSVVFWRGGLLTRCLCLFYRKQILPKYAAARLEMQDDSNEIK